MSGGVPDCDRCAGSKGKTGAARAKEAAQAKAAAQAKTPPKATPAPRPPPPTSKAGIAAKTVRANAAMKFKESLDLAVTEAAAKEGGAAAEPVDTGALSDAIEEACHEATGACTLPVLADAHCSADPAYPLRMLTK